MAPTETPSSEEPVFTGKADEFESGLIPSEAPEPPAVRAAREAQAKAEAHIETAIPADVLSALSPADLATVVKAATAQMSAELGAVRAELAQVKAGQGVNPATQNAGVSGYPYMYWRKPIEKWPDKTSLGWVFVAGGGATPSGNRDHGVYNVLARKGCSPITRYGFINPPETEKQIDRFMPMLLKGGAVEFPASQVIAYQWHVRPPIKGLTFPQYEAIKDTVKTFECEECGKAYYYTPDTARSTAKEYRGHLITGHKVPWREASEAVAQTGLKLRVSDNTAPVSVETMINLPAPV